MKGNEDIHRYDDIIGLPHHRSAVRPHMPDAERAAQFSPFAALTGFHEAIRRTPGPEDDEFCLSEAREEKLDEKIHILERMLPDAPPVSITCAAEGAGKGNRACVTVTKRVRRIDAAERVIVFADGTRAAFDDIRDIRIEPPETPGIPPHEK